MTRTFSLVFLFLLSLFSAGVHAGPLVMRQNGSAVTFQTTQTTTTPVGPMIQTCVVTLTPVTDANGNPEVQEVSDCTLSPNTSNGTSTDNGSSSGSGSDDSGSSSQGNGAISVDGFSSDTTSATAAATATDLSDNTSSFTTDSAATSSATTTDGSSDSSSSSGTSNSSDTNSDGSAATSVSGSTQTAAADNAASNSAQASVVTATAAAELAAAAVPGKSLNVLPIGLGVFAGISVIALIVVGLVTYERTKYRKAFRQRKLAESGAAMGYGGNATR